MSIAASGSSDGSARATRPPYGQNRDYSVSTTRSQSNQRPLLDDPEVNVGTWLPAAWVTVPDEVRGVRGVASVAFRHVEDGERGDENAVAFELLPLPLCMIGSSMSQVPRRDCRRRAGLEHLSVASEHCRTLSPCVPMSDHWFKSTVLGCRSVP